MNNDDRNPYADIIDLPHHVSPTRKRIPIKDRAAQFAPFAALTGYDSAIAETARYTEDSVELDENRKAEIDQVLQWIEEELETRPEVTITWFVPDDRKEGGEFRTERKQIRKLDPIKRTILTMDGTEISIDSITDMML